MICFVPYVYDTERDVWTAPPPARGSVETFELPVCNANGVDLLLTIGLAPEPHGLMRLDAFASLLTAALRRHLDHRSPELAPVQDTTPGKMTTVFPGRDEGYLERRLGELATLVQRSRAAGATHFGWG